MKTWRANVFSPSELLLCKICIKLHPSSHKLDQLPCPVKEMHHHHHFRWLPSPYLMVNVVCLRTSFSSVKDTFLKHMSEKKSSHILWMSASSPVSIL